jgi:hypothetical protein
MFIFLCEFFVVLKYDEMNYNLVLRVFIMYSEMQIQVIWNNHEFGVLMNGNVKCVDNQGRTSKCMHVKCKYVVAVMWNNFARIKFHFYKSGLTSILKSRYLGATLFGFTKWLFLWSSISWVMKNGIHTLLLDF